MLRCKSFALHSTALHYFSTADNTVNSVEHVIDSEAELQGVLYRGLPGLKQGVAPIICAAPGLCVRISRAGAGAQQVGE